MFFRIMRQTDTKFSASSHALFYFSQIYFVSLHLFLRCLFSYSQLLSVEGWWTRGERKLFHMLICLTLIKPEMLLSNEVLKVCETHI